MPPQLSEQAIQSSSLHIELQPRADSVGPFELARQIENLGWLCGIAHASAVDHAISWDKPEDDVQGYQPVLRHARFGSPVSLLVELPGPLLSGVASMSLLIYGVKRIWGLRLEFRTHREEQVARFRKAALAAEEAGMKLEDLERLRMETVIRGATEEREKFRVEGKPQQPSRADSVRRVRDAEREFQRGIDEMAKGRGWSPSAINRIERMRTPAWEPKSATWFLDED